ncbi:unnamed protein product [Durusdinium trenchii]|uniref:Uncharacterized protein n=1 Tax=Durusdinium trenchii TaxID=1381693 RepID=A0ABP0NCF9_9DINO
MARIDTNVALSPVRQELTRLRAGLTDSQARHRDTALLLERLSGQNASLRAQLRECSGAEAAGLSSSPLRNISNLKEQNTPKTRVFQPPTPRRNVVSTPSEGRPAETDALRHRVWQLERHLEDEKRRNAVLQRSLDQIRSGQPNKQPEASELATLELELKSLATERKLLEDAVEVRQRAAPFAQEFVALGSSVGQLQQELSQEFEAVRLLHREEMRLASTEHTLEQRVSMMQQELSISEATTASCRASLQTAHVEAGKNEVGVSSS